MLLAALLFVTFTQHKLPDKIVDTAWDEVEGGFCFNQKDYVYITVPRLKLRSAAATKRANEIIEREVRDEVRYDDLDPLQKTKPDVCKGKRVEQHWEGNTTECKVTFATDRFVSIQCSHGSEGTHPDYATSGINLLVHGDEVEELRFDQLFVDDARAAIADHVTRAMESAAVCTPENLDDDLQAATFDRAGMELAFGHHTFGREFEFVTIPWKDLRGIVRPEILSGYTLRRLRGTSGSRSGRD